MKKIGIITIITNNCGNRLQNYALQAQLQKMGYIVETVKNNETRNTKKFYLLRKIKNTLCPKHIVTNPAFDDFSSRIVFSKKEITAYYWPNSEYDFFITGSDQVWNPYFDRLREVDMLAGIKPEKRISYAASFGVSDIDEKNKKKVKKNISKFKAISVREDRGKELIEEITNREDCQVVLDPTLLLSKDEWDQVTKKPDNLTTNSYIFCYFLGGWNNTKKEAIYNYAKQNNLQVIDLLGKNSNLGALGPSEFIYLIKSSELVCTDSFHASVFSFIYDKSFIVFSRGDNTKSMNSRIDSLVNHLRLGKRYFDKEIKPENVKHDYTEGYELLKIEQNKSEKFLRDAVEDSNNE